MVACGLIVKPLYELVSLLLYNIAPSVCFVLLTDLVKRNMLAVVSHFMNGMLRLNHGYKSSDY